MPELTDKQLIDAVDCWLAPGECDLYCEDCPLYGKLPEGITCQEAVRLAVHKRIKESSK
jgi:hypothetical protein